MLFESNIFYVCGLSAIQDVVLGRMLLPLNESVRLIQRHRSKKGAISYKIIESYLVQFPIRLKMILFLWPGCPLKYLLCQNSLLERQELKQNFNWKTKLDFNLMIGSQRLPKLARLLPRGAGLTGTTRVYFILSPCPLSPCPRGQHIGLLPLFGSLQPK